MQIQQIIIRLNTQQIVAQHANSIGTRGTVYVPYSELAADQIAAIDKIITAVQAKLPPDPSPQTVQEIADLETRLAELRQSIGVG